MYQYCIVLTADWYYDQAIYRNKFTQGGSFGPPPPPPSHPHDFPKVKDKALE